MRFDPLAHRWWLAVATSAAVAAHSPDASAQAAPVPAAAPPPVIRAYAWIKPTVIVQASPVESFSQPNMIAATAAGNPVLTAIQDEAAITFQAAQSRLGFWFNEKGPIRGQFELDFVDFSKSSPTTASVPRLRIAKLEWGLSDSTVLTAGQDWDLFQPANAHTVDIVAVAFQAGNTAFMRQQAKLIWHNESLELGAALGLAGNNNGAKALIPEYARIPTFALRAAKLFGAAGRIGVSAIATSWRFAPDAAAERNALTGGVGLYGDVTPAAGFNLRFEAYAGRNLANIGALSLGTGNAVDDLDEVGGFVSARYALTETHALYGHAGMAKVLNDEDVLPSYTYGAVAMGMTPAESSATLAGTGAGITQNMVARLGYEYRFDKTIAVMAEGFWFNTKHVLNQDFDADLDADRMAVGGEIGLFFTL